ncbi:hypothetical protein B0H14DRAFT_2611282 [Mycena olivaceomarginata]|nr:hypothetical protein B0H14DRAFT_2611282 [Mycena olivaceomarginata]
MLSLARPAQQRPTKLLSQSELVVLWIHRARYLAQDLHHTTRITVKEETPEDTVGLIRDAVSVLLKNIVALGKASLRYHGDASPFDRALMFNNLNMLYRTMVLDEGYLRFGINFPNFDVSKADLEWYGIYEFIKPRQITRLSSEDLGTVVHQFGDHLLRYNPKLGDEAWYQFPDRSREYAAIQPNTPVPSPVAEVADETMEEEEDSDKETESPCFGKRLSPIPATGAVCQLLIRPPGSRVSSISRFLPLLNALSLEDKTLELIRWHPSEGWAAFLEFRLCPMVYFVHAAVTHDFTLISAKGVYSLVELDHIKYWVGHVLLHCVGDFVLVAIQGG